MNPVAQGLPVHAGVPRRFLPRGPLQHEGERQHAACRPRVPAPARFGVRLHERSVGTVLYRLGFARLSVRPKHPLSDPAAQEAFKKASPSW